MTCDLCPSLLSPRVPLTKVTVNYYEEEGSAPIDQAGLFLTAIGELGLEFGCLLFGVPGTMLWAGFGGSWFLEQNMCTLRLLFKEGGLL